MALFDRGEINRGGGQRLCKGGAEDGKNCLHQKRPHSLYTDKLDTRGVQQHDKDI